MALALRKKPINYFRVIMQGLILLLLAYLVVRPFVDKNYQSDYEAYCPFGGMQALSSYLVTNSLACSMTTLQIAMGLALIIGVILFSKLFCSYLCPVGIFTEWLGRIGQKLKIRFTVRGIADKLLRALKYLLLFLTFFYTIRSSELFCKKFDPYYALFSGFGPDVVLWYALAAIAITVLGSLVVRQFWCKYLCPLGAATNIFSYVIVFASITVIYLLLVMALKVRISWVWYLAVLCAAGFVTEAFRMRFLVFPLVKVTRDGDICTGCQICDKVCPMAIEVSKAKTVQHIDCHLCLDCVAKCPEKGALTVNRRKLGFVPPAAIILLVALGIVLSSSHEVPTINLRWGTPEEISRSSVYTQSGLKNVKCFGSSMAFAEQIKEIPGILGVETYVKKHTVKIFFDPEQITPAQIRKDIFRPVKRLVNFPEEDVKMMKSAEFGLDHFFDANDSYFLSQKLKQVSGVFGFETEYGEPVLARIFFDEHRTSQEKIRQVIDNPDLEYMFNKEKVHEKTDFKVASADKSPKEILKVDFLKSMFSPFDETFNEYNAIDTNQLTVCQVPFPQALSWENKRWVPYLSNHLSKNPGIVRFQTTFSENVPVLRVYYLAGKTSPEAIHENLNAAKFKITYEDGTSEELDNPFSFKQQGTIIQPSAVTEKQKK